MTTRETGYIEEHCRKLFEYRELDFRRNCLWPLIKRYVRGRRVLDLGCGYGQMSLRMARLGYEVTAADISATMIDALKKMAAALPITALVTDARNVRELGRDAFDSVVCLDLLEHIDEDDQVLQDIYCTLKGNGRLVLAVPALEWLYGIRDKKLGHVRRYSRYNLKDKLLKSGYEIHTIRYWNLIGLAPYIFFEKILRSEIYDGMRYSKSPTNRTLNHLLRCILSLENYVPLPAGLSIFAVAQKRP